MNILKMLQEKFKKQEVEIKNNYYHERDGKEFFVYNYDLTKQQEENYKRVTLESIKPVDNIDGIQLGEQLYECTIWYDYGKPSLADLATKSFYYGFEKILVQFDYEKMKKDEAYTSFVFENLVNPTRVRTIHDIAFGLIEGIPFGNYVGGIIEKDDKLSASINPEIGKIVNNSIEMNNLRKQYLQNENKKEEEKEKFQQYHEEKQELTRQQRIDELKNELEKLTTDENNNDLSSKQI